MAPKPLTTPQWVERLSAINSQTPNPQLLQQATAEILAALEHKSSVVHLAEILDTSSDVALKTGAALYLKRAVEKHWRKQDKAVQTRLRAVLLALVRQLPAGSLLNAVAGVVSRVARFSLSQAKSKWDELLVLLDAMLEAEAPAEKKGVALLIWRYILEKTGSVFSGRYSQLSQQFSAHLAPRANSSYLVAVAATRALKQILFWIPEPSLAAQLQDGVPLVVGAIQAALANHDVESASHCFEYLEDLLEIPADVFGPHADNVLLTFAKLVADRGVQFEIRARAGTLVVWFCKTKASELQQSKRLPDLLRLGVTLSCEPLDDEAAAGSGTAEAGLGGDSPHSIGTGIVDAILANVEPPKPAFEMLTSSCQKLMQSPNAWDRQGGFLALGVAVESVIGLIAPLVPELVKVVERTVREDASLLVRRAALELLLQLLDYVPHAVLEDQETVFSVILFALGGVPDPQAHVQHSACKLLDAMIEVDADDLTLPPQQLEPLLQELTKLLTSPDLVQGIREASVTAIGALARAAGATFRPYFPKLVNEVLWPMMTQVEDLELRAVAMGAFGNACTAGGAEITKNALLPQAFTLALQHLTAADDQSVFPPEEFLDAQNELRGASFNFFQSMLDEALRPAFIEAKIDNELVMLIALAEALATVERSDVSGRENGDDGFGSAPGLNGGGGGGRRSAHVHGPGCSHGHGGHDHDHDDEDSDDDEEDDHGDVRVSVWQPVLIEKMYAIAFLSQLVEVMPANVSRDLGLLKRMLATLSHNDSEIFMFPRAEVITSLCELTQAMSFAALRTYPPAAPWQSATTPEQSAMSPQATEITAFLVAQLCSVAESDNEIDAVTSACHALSMLVHDHGPQLVQQHAESLDELSLAVLKMQTFSQRQRAHDELLMTTPVIDAWTLLFEEILQVAPAFAEKCLEKYMPLLDTFLKPERPITHRASVVGFLAHCVNNVSPARAVALMDKYNAVVFGGLDTADDADMLQNSFFFIGCLVHTLGDVPQSKQLVARCLPLVLRFINEDHPDMPDTIRDNCTAVLIKWLAAAPQSVAAAGDPAALLALAFAHLPLESDVQEMPRVFLSLLRLVAERPASVLDVHPLDTLALFAQGLMVKDRHLLDEFIRGQIAACVRSLVLAKPELRAVVDSEAMRPEFRAVIQDVCK